MTQARSHPPMFPRVAGRNLNGVGYDLPGDFEGAWNLVFLAFFQPQQAQVDTWLPYADDLAARHPGLRVYELPTLTRGYGLFRAFIDGGMRSGIPDPVARARTITLYLDRTRFLQALGLDRTDTIHALLVTPAGEIPWRADGGFAEDKARALVETLVALTEG